MRKAFSTEAEQQRNQSSDNARKRCVDSHFADRERLIKGRETDAASEARDNSPEQRGPARNRLSNKQGQQQHKRETRSVRDHDDAKDVSGLGSNTPAEIRRAPGDSRGEAQARGNEGWHGSGFAPRFFFW